MKKQLILLQEHHHFSSYIGTPSPTLHTMELFVDSGNGKIYFGLIYKLTHLSPSLFLIRGCTRWTNYFFKNNSVSRPRSIPHLYHLQTRIFRIRLRGQVRLPDWE